MSLGVVVAFGALGCAPPASEGPLFRGQTEVAPHGVDAAMPSDAAAPDLVVRPTPDASDGAVDAGPNVFVGGPAFASAPVATSARAQMTTSGTNPTRTSCLTCHVPGMKGGALFAGGTVFIDKAAAHAAIDVEIRVVDLASGAVFGAHTDADGNFWIPAPAQLAAGPFEIGVRDATHAQTMPVLQRALDCGGSACHGGGQGPVHLE